MTTLRERVFQSISSAPRSIYDLVRSIALFVPEDHELAASLHTCMDSLGFSPPELHAMHLRLWMEHFGSEFPDSEFPDSESLPVWAKVISVLVSAGSDKVPAIELEKPIHLILDESTKVESSGGRVVLWGGRRIEEFTREELIEIVVSLGRMVERQADDFRTDLRRVSELSK